MRRLVAPAPLLALMLVSLTACGIGDTGPAPAGAPASGLPSPGGQPADVVHVYFSSPLGLERVSRPYRGSDLPQAAMKRLLQGPDPVERSRGLVSFIPPGIPTPAAVPRRHGIVDVYLPPAWTTDRTALRQLVCTAADAGADDELRPHSIRVRLHRPGADGPTTHMCAGGA